MEISGIKPDDKKRKTNVAMIFVIPNSGRSGKAECISCRTKKEQLERIVPPL